MAHENRAVIFSEVPDGLPVPGKNLTVKSIGQFDPSSLPANSIAIEILYLSMDPYMRGRMREASTKSYNNPFTIDEPIQNTGLARILKSTSKDYAEGSIVKTMLPYQEYLVIELDKTERKPETIDVENGPKDMRHWLGALGMPGLTAYSSLYEIGQPKKGETIFISSAAGAVGQIVGAVAKHEGLTVIGSVGSDEKLKFLTEELGFDGGFNYKTEKASDALSRLAPNGIDIYYENVGGDQLEAAMAALNLRGRIVACGMISQYNKKPEDQYGVRTLMMVVQKRLLIRGFIVGDEDMGPKYAREHRETVSRWLKDGTLKAKVSEWAGIDQGPAGVVGMLKGDNFGKAVLKVKV